MDNLRWTARRKFAGRGNILLGNNTEAPDTAYVKIGGDFTSSTTPLDIETATVPRTMVMAVLTVLRLPARTMCPRPLCR